MTERVVKHSRPRRKLIECGRATAVLAVGAQSTGGQMVESDEDCGTEMGHARIVEVDPQVTQISRF